MGRWKEEQMSWFISVLNGAAPLSIIGIVYRASKLFRNQLSDILKKKQNLPPQKKLHLILNRERNYKSGINIQ